MYRPWKAIGFYSSGEPEMEESSTASRFSLRTDQPTSLVFFSFLVEFHRDRGIEWRGILYPAYPVLPQSPTTHIPCILQRFWHKLSRASIYSSQKHNIVSPEMTSEANSSSVIPRSWTWKCAKLQTLKIRRKLTKIATAIIFSQSWSGEKGKLY